MVVNGDLTRYVLNVGGKKYLWILYIIQEKEDMRILGGVNLPGM